MAKNIELMGAVFPDVPSILIPQHEGGLVSYVDVTDTTASASDVATGKYFYSADGTRTAGTNSGGGGGKNAQIANNSGRANSTSYVDTGVSIKVAKTGTYDVYWVGYRTTTTGTSGSKLTIDGTDYGDAQETFGTPSNNLQSPHLSNVSLTQGQTISLKARSRNAQYYMYVMNLTIIES